MRRSKSEQTLHDKLDMIISELAYRNDEDEVNELPIRYDSVKPITAVNTDREYAQLYARLTYKQRYFVNNLINEKAVFQLKSRGSNRPNINVICRQPY